VWREAKLHIIGIIPPFEALLIQNIISTHRAPYSFCGHRTLIDAILVLVILIDERLLFVLETHRWCSAAIGSGVQLIRNNSSLYLVTEAMLSVQGSAARIYEIGCIISG